MKSRKPSSVIHDVMPQAIPVEQPSEEKPLKTLVYPFQLQQLVMKKGDWEIHLVIAGKMKQVDRAYKLTLVVDLDEINQKISKAEKDLQYNQIDIDGTSEAEEHVNQLQKAKTELIANCPDIPFVGLVMETKYRPFDTLLKLHISPEVINDLNDKRLYISSYKLKMEQINP